MSHVAFGIVADDFDGDEKLDIATVDLSSTVPIRRNISMGIGDVSFADPENYETGPAPAGLLTADFDSDGRSDIATVNGNGNSVSILRNSSVPGSLEWVKREWDFGVGSNSQYLAKGDLNNDGRVDIVTSNSQANTLSVVINNGNGAGNVDFIARKDYLTPKYARVFSVDRADFDGDGSADLAASFDPASNVFRVSIYRNDGVGHFPSRIDLIPTTPSGLDLLFLTANDFDSDGKPDLAILADWEGGGNPFSSGLRIYRNISAGPGNIAFQEALVRSFSFPLRITSRDLDQNGKPDLIISNEVSPSSGETTFVLQNVSSGPGSISFVNGPSFATPGVKGRVLAEDLNADGKVDLTFNNINVNPGTLTVQINNGTGPGQISFQPQLLAVSGVQFGETIAEDADLDGRADLISSTENESLSVFRNESSDGQLSLAPRIKYLQQPMVPGWMSDLDGDDRPDILATNRYGGSSYLSIFLNESPGPGTLSFAIPPKVFAAGGSLNEGFLAAVFADDLNNDGKKDIVTGFAGASAGTITVLLSAECGSSLRTPFDYDGDGKTDFSVFRPADGAWYLQRSTAGFQGLQFGADGDKLTPADYDGDGKTDIAVYRPSAGQWYVLNSATGTVSYPVFGVAEDLPAPGDYDGDGKADLTVFRPSQGTWYRQNSSNGSFFGFQFGATGDVPTVGDFDGDGKNDLGIWRPSLGDWYNIRSSNQSVFGERFGQTGDKIAPADYDGDGKTDIAIYRPSTGLWVVRNSATATYSYSVFGAPADIPISGDYDGDGKADIGVWRPSDGTWYVQRSSNGQFIVFPWGQNGDVPTPSAFGN